YLWGQLTYYNGNPIFQPINNYSSGNLMSTISTNAIAVMRVNQTYVPLGDEVMIMIV
ncbi:MAG: molybdopterin molybdenumtransferase MoeA, partial [Pseudanabaena sp.]